MLLSYNEICELIEQGVIEFADYNCVNSASLDIHIGDHVLLEADEGSVLVLRDRTPLKTVQHRLPFDVLPGEFILASSREVFHLPNNISAEYKLKSSIDVYKRQAPRTWSTRAETTPPWRVPKGFSSSGRTSSSAVMTAGPTWVVRMPR